MPIFRRLGFTFLAAALVPSIIILLLNSFFVQSLEGRGQAVQTSFDAQNAATDQYANLQRMNALLATYFSQTFAAGGRVAPQGDTTLDASRNLTRSEINALEIDFDQKLQTYRQNYTIATSDRMATIRSILTSDDPNSTVISDQSETLNTIAGVQWKNYKKDQDAVLAQLDDANKPGNAGQVMGNYTSTYDTLYQANRAYLDLKNSWQQVVNDATTVGTQVTHIGPSLLFPQSAYTGLAIFFLGAMMILIYYMVNTTITYPLAQLAALTKRIATGETNERALVTGRDEISVVAASLNTMLDSIVRLAREAQDRHTSLITQIEKLVNEVSGVAEGDLRIQAEVTTDELGVLADSFNYMTEELSNLVVRVQGMAHDVERATALGFGQMTEMVASGDGQIQQIVKAAMEISEMANSSRKVAERAQVLAEMATEASRTAQSGRLAVQQTIDGMNRINTNVHTTSEKVQLLGERSREINAIVKAISSIAHQTNRLALDAAIQAAMAGENGKGFGAVASDIRRLAERSKEQTQQITQIVNDVLEDINAAADAMLATEHEAAAGSQMVSEAGSALEAVFSVVEHQAGEITSINQVAIQQLQTSNAVVQMMQSVSDITQKAATSTREVSVQMEHIARLAEQLNASVEVFKLRDNQVPPQYQLAPAGQDYGRVQIPQFAQTAQATPSVPGRQFQPSGFPFQASPVSVPLTPASPQRFASAPSTPFPPNEAWESQPNGSNGNGGGRLHSSRLERDSRG